MASRISRNVPDNDRPAAKPAGRVKLGSLLAAIGREARLTKAQGNELRHLRDTARATPIDLS